VLKAHHHNKTSRNTAGAAAESLDPALYGQWTTIAHGDTVGPIHVTLLYTGKVLILAGSGNNPDNMAQGSFTGELWNPVTNKTSRVRPPWDMFCAGHLVEPDGNVIIMGGTLAYPADDDHPWTGSNKVYRFNTKIEQWEVGFPRWEALPSMISGRWYPTAVQDPTGDKVLVYSGLDEYGDFANTPESYSRTSNSWSTLPDFPLPLYPGLLWTSKDELFFSGAASGQTDLPAGLLSPYTGAFKAVSGGVNMTTRNGAATVFAGAAQDQLAWLVGGGFPATDSTVLTDLGAADPVSVVGPALPTAKAYVSAVNLPDLRVLETGGGTARSTPVYEASIFNPNDGTLTPVAPPSVGRTYHSSAILLPDGSVATFGGDPGFGAGDREYRIEIYKPDYFFKGPRPVITAGAKNVTYGGAYKYRTTATEATVASAVIVKPASTTHSIDANQRSVLLSLTPTKLGVFVTMPNARNIAPPGWYMLFLIDSLGRPSEAKWVHLT
jgi:hypothetical protein